MTGFTEISATNLWRLIGTPDAPILVDVRLDEDFAADPRLIPTARRVSHLALDPAAFTGNRVVVTCQRGLKLSHGAAALLRTAGITAEVLQGGHLAYVAAGLPLTEQAALPASDLWVTRQRPKIDRIACPWLIRRFVNPNAKFLFVPASEVEAVAERFNATPFDIEGVRFSHRGDLCSFDAMIADFGFANPALHRLALVVRAADTDHHDHSPQAAGLLAISVGLSRLYKDDLAQLEAGMTLYDALYRWARDGQEEGHDWPAARS
ncbi:MAG: sulfurtransferase/chromate resistance protein [Deltaproteobacteria bacterium]